MTCTDKPCPALLDALHDHALTIAALDLAVPIAALDLVLEYLSHGGGYGTHWRCFEGSGCQVPACVERLRAALGITDADVAEAYLPPAKRRKAYDLGRLLVVGRHRLRGRLLVRLPGRRVCGAADRTAADRRARKKLVDSGRTLEGRIVVPQGQRPDDPTAEPPPRAPREHIVLTVVAIFEPPLLVGGEGRLKVLQLARGQDPMVLVSAYHALTQFCVGHIEQMARAGHVAAPPETKDN